MNVKIIPFEPKYAGIFSELNKAWLEKYFYIEPKDVQLLENCQETILDRGGFIYFAEYGPSLVGCYSLIPFGHNSFELGKMAVDPSYQGLKIGQSLLTHAIHLAKDKGWKKIVLYSSTKLGSALHIYRKFGFREVVLENDNPYARSDIKMELEME